MNRFWVISLIVAHFSRIRSDPYLGECTFDEESGPCEYVQGSNDDFDWQLIGIHDPSQQTPDLLRGSYMMVNSSQHNPGQKAHFILPSLSENDTHCIQFSYFLYSRDGGSPGSLHVFIRVNNGPVGDSVWNVSGSHGQQWLQAELAVSTFWPNEYQVMFEAVVSTEQRGYIGIDDVLILNYPCDKTPHFLRLGDVETNSGQNATFQCVAAGRMADTQRLLLQRQHRGTIPVALLKCTSPKRILATFQLHEVTKKDQDLYRCVSRSVKGSGVSNFAELIIKEPPIPAAPPQLIRAGSTYLMVHLNTNSIFGDGPVIRKEIEYKVTLGSWSEVQAVNSLNYKLWHLDPDTEYQISVLLTRPGEGGTGIPGPRLISKTKCAEPMRAPKDLTFSEIKPRQITLQWEPLGYNITRCHTYSIIVCYHYTFGVGHNQTFRECRRTESEVSWLTIKNLLPYKNIYVKLILTNPEGKRESKEHIFQTDEDVPGGIPAESISGTPLEDMIFLKWNEPLEPNGVIIQYEISYQCIESSDPAVIVPGLQKTLSKPWNETHHMFSNLEPGTTYRFSVRASTSKGFGQTVLTEVTTNITAPSFDYSNMPPPLGETDTTITVELKPAQGRGAPVSVYQVVVEEDKKHKVKRETRTHKCFPFPIGHEEAAVEGVPHYYSAELPPSSLREPMPFTVGDNNTYNGYWNAPLEPKKGYNIYFQAMSKFKRETKTNCILIAKKAAACKENKESQETTQHSDEMGLTLGICAGSLAAFILILGTTFLLVKKGKPTRIKKTVKSSRHDRTHMMNAMDRSFTDQSTLQEDEKLETSFIGTYNCSTRCKPSQKDEQHNMMNESSSLLGSSSLSPRGRAGSPYQTGQLHPAVRVADLLQHINQMKTAEGYGFKQEYESFFEGQVSSREMSKKKENRSKSRHENIISYDCHRVKLHPLLGDSSSDYVNVSYIDGYHKAKHFIATQGPKQEMVYNFWRMMWQERCSSVVMLTKLVEVGRVKCCKYWPDDTELYGDIKVTLMETEFRAEYTVRTFFLERRGYSARHEVQQFHFTAWPEHGVPYHATGLLAFLRRIKISNPPDSGPIVVHCSACAGRTGCYIVLDVMLDMAECEGVVDVYNCVKTLHSRRINMIQTEEQYIFIHDAILEACLCGDTSISVCEFKSTYKEMVRIDPQSNSSQLKEEFQALNSVTPHLDAEECSIALLPRNQEKNRNMDVLPPDRCLPFLNAVDGESNNYINAALMDSYSQAEAFVVTPHPLQNTTTDFWRLVYDYKCTSVIMLNQINQLNSAWPCLQYWPERGFKQYGPIQVEFISCMMNEEMVSRLFRIKNLSRLQEGQLIMQHFQYLRWSPHRDVPESKESFLNLLKKIEKWWAECGEGRTIVHCLNGGGRSGTLCASIIIQEMIKYQKMVDVFHAVKTLRNSKPNMVESLEQYCFCYDIALDYMEFLESG
ncbi:receptor-type tyrosine-protein phosphatase U isoform X1 [Carcharodon carcharias]|uniref:receptor-type tyrosine-protein phosphatase U isoform X1 n=2 Tax=Carcharodon carcharias TaxID=13397 RepID=UPI001B7E01F6|nr:receptor-type tyrosine-protein phosphatase U isoform X1 [Carcharodon carcharias]